MSIETDLDAALKPLVSNRVYAGIFPQPPERPVWPAIRRTTFGIPDADLCGDSDDDASDIRLQLDIVVTESAGYNTLRTLRAEVRAAMRTFIPPAIWDGDIYTFDEETRTHRWILDYLIYPSSPDS